MKRNGEISWCGVSEICAKAQENERPTEGVAVLLNDVWYIVLSSDVWQARKMVQGRCEWQGFMRRNAWGVAREINPYMKPLKSINPYVTEPTT